MHHSAVDDSMASGCLSRRWASVPDIGYSVADFNIINAYCSKGAATDVTASVLMNPQ